MLKNVENSIRERSAKKSKDNSTCECVPRNKVRTKRLARSFRKNKKARLQTASGLHFNYDKREINYTLVYPNRLQINTDMLPSDQYSFSR